MIYFLAIRQWRPAYYKYFGIGYVAVRGPVATTNYVHFWFRTAQGTIIATLV